MHMATFNFINFARGAVRFGAPKIRKITVKKTVEWINFVTFRRGLAGNSMHVDTA